MNITPATLRHEPLAPGQHARNWARSCRRAISSGFPSRHCGQIAGGAYALKDERLEAWGKITRSVNNRGITLLCGPQGVGKTHLLSLMGCLWNEYGYAEKYGKARYRTLTDLLDEQKRWFDRKRDEYGNAIEAPLDAARGVGLLVLDELNELRANSEFGQGAFVQLLDARYRTGLPTVLSTNLMWEKYREKFGASAFDRIKEGGEIVKCEWNSYRDTLRKRDKQMETV